MIGNSCQGLFYVMYVLCIPVHKVLIRCIECFHSIILNSSLHININITCAAYIKFPFSIVGTTRPKPANPGSLFTGFSDKFGSKAISDRPQPQDKTSSILKFKNKKFFQTAVYTAVQKNCRTLRAVEN